MILFFFCICLQTIDYRHRTGSYGHYLCFIHCFCVHYAIPAWPGHSPQASYEEIHGKRRGQLNSDELSVMISVSTYFFHSCFMCLKSLEPMDPGEKGARGHVRILKPAELRKIKLLGQGVFGSVHKVLVIISAVCHLHVLYVFNKLNFVSILYLPGHLDS